MYIPKRYGQSKIEKCPFCGEQSLTLNPQKIPVCVKHKMRKLEGMKCVCGQTLDVRHGKFGAFFVCMTCGPVNMRKVLLVNSP